MKVLKISGQNTVFLPKIGAALAEWKFVLYNHIVYCPVVWAKMCALKVLACEKGGLKC